MRGLYILTGQRILAAIPDASIRQPKLLQILRRQCCLASMVACEGLIRRLTHTLLAPQLMPLRQPLSAVRPAGEYQKLENNLSAKVIRSTPKCPSVGCWSRLLTNTF